MLNSELEYHRKRGFTHTYTSLVQDFNNISLRTKRVRHSRPIKLFIWVLFMFSVEGHTEH